MDIGKVSKNTIYILFLKHLDVPDGYTYKNDEAIVLLFYLYHHTMGNIH